MENELSITLKVGDWNIVFNALGQRPYGEVAALFDEMQRQVKHQINPPAPVDGVNEPDKP